MTANWARVAMAAALLTVVAGCSGPSEEVVRAAIEEAAGAIDQDPRSIRVDSVSWASSTYGVKGDQYPRYRLDAEGRASAVEPRYAELDPSEIAARCGDAARAAPDPGDKGRVFLRTVVPIGGQMAFRADMSSNREDSPDYTAWVHRLELFDLETGSPLAGEFRPWWAAGERSLTICDG